MVYIIIIIIIIIYSFFFEGEAVSVTSTSFQTGPQFFNITNMSYNKIYTMYLQYIYKIGIENYYIHWFYIEQLWTSDELLHATNILKS